MGNVFCTVFTVYYCTIFDSFYAFSMIQVLRSTVIIITVIQVIKYMILWSDLKLQSFINLNIRICIVVLVKSIEAAKSES